ncbi:MAG TPA: alpha/beta hydrolase-fold protein [Solirubrobacteraceae bacterium]|nr:alpha/beta hydrolase-fold protein [Solirubrobacteraceae bacterium]
MRRRRTAAPLLAFGVAVLLLVSACGATAQAHRRPRSPRPIARAGSLAHVPGALTDLPRQGSGWLLSEHFYSPALHREAGYLIYLPPGYSPLHRYPVYYLLHGMPGQPHVFITLANLDVRLDALLAAHRVQPMILVFPDGRIGGSVQSDSEWANTPAGAYENAVLDVVANVDARFSTIPRRSARVIAGFSAGAYGAVNIALHHLSVFGGVQAWSGYYLQTATGVFAHATPAQLAANSPLDEVRGLGRRLRAEPLRVVLLTGRDDSSAAQQGPMAAALRADGSTVTAAEYPGGHQWGVWYPRLNAMLINASEDFRAG